MRNIIGKSSDSTYPATASFAASMNSSISLFASLRGALDTPAISPESLNSINASGKSKSIEPRRTRFLFKIPASSFINSNRGTKAL